MQNASSHLRYDDISQRPGEPEELQRVLQAQGAVVLHVVLDAVVYVGDLADVIAAALHAEVSLQFGPALEHQLQGLTVIKLQVCGAGRPNTSLIFSVVVGVQY